MKRILALLLLIALPVWATVSISEEPDDDNITKITYTWISNASGIATGITSNSYTGVILRVVFNPDDSSVPTAAYDVTVTDNNSADILDGLGADLSATATTQKLTAFSSVLNSKLRINVSNAGESKAGQVIVYLGTDEAYSFADSSVTGEKLATALWSEIKSIASDSARAAASDSAKLDDVSLADVQSATTSDFHNIGGTDDDIPDADEVVEAAIAGNAVTWAKIDTGAIGFVDVRKFGAVGNGVADDTDEIRAALLYAHTNGGIVLFPGDSTTTYLVSDSMHVRSDVHVLGYGAWIKRADAVTSHVFVVPGGSNNVTFSGINIDHNYRGQGSTTIASAIWIGVANNTLIERCQFRNGSYTIRSTGINYNTAIDRCYFDGCYESIMLYEARDCRITNCRSDFESTIDYPTGCHNFGGSFSIYNTVGATIENNTVVMPDSVWDATEKVAICISSQSDTTKAVVVKDNKIWCNEAYQFGITQHVSEHMQDVEITNNYINGATAIAGIEINAGHTIAVDNTVDSCYVGIAINTVGFLRGISVKHNTIKNATTSAITINSKLLNSDIVDNIIEDCGTTVLHAGIYSNNGGKHNKYINNTINNVSGTGINISGNVDLTINNNKISNTNIGMYFSSDTLLGLTSNTIDSTASFGLSISGGADVLISTNGIKHTLAGMYVFGGTDNFSATNNIISNTIDAANSHAFRIESLIGGSFIGNTIINPDGTGITVTTIGDTSRNNYIAFNKFIYNDPLLDCNTNVIRVNKAKNTTLFANDIVLNAGINVLSYSGIINIDGNSDSTRVLYNVIRGDSTARWNTSAIYFADDKQDYCQFRDNIINGFAYGLRNLNTRSTNIIDNNKISNCTDAYVLGNATIERIVDAGKIGIGKEPAAGIELDVEGDIAANTLAVSTFKFVVKTDTLCSVVGTDTLRIHPLRP